MSRLLQGISLFLLSCSAFAIEEPPKTTTTTWQIYGAVLAVIVVGFIWVYLKQKKDKEREQRRRDSAGPP